LSESLNVTVVIGVPDGVLSAIVNAVVDETNVGTTAANKRK